MPLPALRSTDRTALLPLLVAACLAAVAVAATLHQVTDDLLRGEARAEALAWARCAAQRESPCTGPTQAVEAFDAQGQPRAPGTQPLQPAQARAVLAGDAAVHWLPRSAGGPWVAEVLVPVQPAGAAPWLARLRIDQTPRQARARQAVIEGSLASWALCLAGVVLVAWRGMQRLNQQRGAAARAHYLAHHDVLSGALNRSSFQEALARAAADGARAHFAVLCIDLDRFKEINDTHGHSVGDDVLRQVGERLRQLMRHGDTVARIGGDEFAVLLAGVTSPHALATLGQRAVEALLQPYEGPGQALSCSGSIGGALFGHDARDTEELMHMADLALYRAKALGRAQYSAYDAALDHQLQQRRALVRDLREALGVVARDDIARRAPSGKVPPDTGDAAAAPAGGPALSLAYQPLYRGRDGELVGYEALMRWTHPTLGPVPPSEFIPLAEEAGLIVPLGRWALRTACLEAARWPEALSVAVNLSPVQFSQGRLVETVAAALDHAGLSAHRLELEITETLLMTNTEQVVQTLKQLSTMGVQIAMDDFGTGYSSLAYLWRFPFDKVKIDRAFTQNLGHDPKVGVIVRSIISLAHALQMRVNAEGVETPPQRDILLRHGCDELQGFLLGRPQPASELPHRAAGPQAPPRTATHPAVTA